MEEIQIDLPPEKCCGGIDALCLGMNFYETKDKSILNDILLYNKFDCESLYVLLEWIRKKMS